MRKLDIGIVGSGTAGPAAALFFARQGHDVTLYERVPDPRPVGAGIMLQPTGQAVLRRLGLYDEVKARGERIEALRVFCDADRLFLSLRYEDAVPGAYGIGLHRGVLFQALFDAVRRAPIDLRLGVAARRFERARGRVRVVDEHGRRSGDHQLLVIADGARSQLRDQTGLLRRCDPYPWGALWYMADDPRRVFTKELYQVVRGTRELLGLLPTGRGPAGQGNDVPQVSLFWSVRADAVESFRRGDFRAWQDKVRALVPEAAFIVDQIEAPEQLLFSGYHDVVMSHWTAQRVAVIGDAAHAMSPQLGQGANLALFDAMLLADAVEVEGGDVVRALDVYSRTRRDHLGYYQTVTRWLTPFFQSDYDALGALRDAAMPLMNRVGLLNRAMVLGMCGTADGHPWATVPLPD